MNSILLQPQQLSKEMKETLQWDFEGVLMRKDTIKEMWLALFEFFIPFETEKQRSFYDPYWKWFVQLTFSNLPMVPKDKFARIVVPQLPLAFLLFDNIEESVFYYMYRLLDPGEEQRTLFRELQRELKSSHSLLNPTSSAGISISQLYANVLQEYDRAEDVLDKSALYARIKKQYITEKHVQMIEQDIVSIDSTVYLMNFLLFLGYERDITQILYDYYDDYYDRIYMAGEKEILSKLEKENPTSVKSPQPVSTTAAPAKPVPLKKEKPVIAPKPLNFLEQLAKQKNILSWLATPQVQKEFISWANTQDKARAKEIIALGIKRQIPTLTESTAQQILELDAWLQIKGYTHKDLILFNEETFSFEWNI
ncbi:MAG: hypothetical protein HOE80_03160 [Candidatus Magasanikbacteria bacterium]|jgi:hypothetical protein|nr:hypothetical protein [Candidatus Magasanikbacteria bacterium]MBT4071697.1 hypothetical protein [Candidatus Magasanikbacteria bacterium]